MTIREWVERLGRRDRVLMACLCLQVVLYWTLVFVMSRGNELVAYQRY